MDAWEERVSSGFPLEDWGALASPELVQDDKIASMPSRPMILYCFMFVFVVLFVISRIQRLHELLPREHSSPSKKV